MSVYAKCVNRSHGDVGQCFADYMNPAACWILAVGKDKELLINLVVKIWFASSCSLPLLLFNSTHNP